MRGLAHDDPQRPIRAELEGFGLDNTVINPILKAEYVSLNSLRLATDEQLLLIPSFGRAALERLRGAIGPSRAKPPPPSDDVVRDDSEDHVDAHARLHGLDSGVNDGLRRLSLVENEIEGFDVALRHHVDITVEKFQEHNERLNVQARNDKDLHEALRALRARVQVLEESLNTLAASVLEATKITEAVNGLIRARLDGHDLAFVTLYTAPDDRALLADVVRQPERYLAKPTGHVSGPWEETPARTFAADCHERGGEHAYSTIPDPRVYGDFLQGPCILCGFKADIASESSEEPPA